MTNVRSTKRALLSSALALFLCFAMLLGTTFAWFTDSVKSANNIIMSGNLDIELEYWNGQAWADVKDHDDILTNDLWEPGVTEIAYFRIANAGTLALKYQLAINFDDVKKGTNVFGREFLLSDYILFGVDEGIAVDANNNNAPVEYESREAAILAVPGVQKVSAGFTKAKSMTAGQELYFSLVVYMPTTVENEANYKTSDDANDPNKYRPEINLGIDVFATQVAYEEDSFDKYYDGATPWLGDVDTTWYNTTDTEFVIGTAEELAGLAELVNTTVDSFAGKTIKLASNIDLNNINWTPIGDVDADDYVGFRGTFDGQNYTIANLYINSNSWGQGLFGYFQNAATVQNVNFYNADVKATDNCGIVVGYATYGTFANISAYGDISVVGTGRDGHVGGLVGCGYNANFDACNVIANDGSKIVSGGPFNGGIVGYQCNNTKSITNCQVRNISITGYTAIGGIAGIVQTGATAIDNCVVSGVVLNKTRIAGNPSIGALFGCYSGTAQTNVTNSTVNNVTLNGYHVEYSAYDVMYGSNYGGATTPNIILDGTTSTGIVNNLKVVLAAKPDDVQSVVDNAAAGSIIALTDTDENGDYCGKYDAVINLKSNLTVIGERDAVVGCINLNGSENITLYSIDFNAENANKIYYTASRVQAIANIISSVPSNNKGARNIVIDDCTFTGEFGTTDAPFKTAIAFVDYGRNGGRSRDITIKNCTFDTKGATYDIYGYYFGDNGNFVVENNTFKSVTTSIPVALGKYASSIPVVVTGNTFETRPYLESAVVIQDHSNYGVSINASNNTFAE